MVAPRNNIRLGSVRRQKCSFRTLCAILIGLYLVTMFCILSRIHIGEESVKGSLLGIDIPASVCDDASVDVPFSSNGSSTVVAAALSPESFICHPRDIPLLIETIKKDLSGLGLRTVCGRVFPGFVAETLQVLRGQRIALLGDSTLAYFTHWLTFS